MGISLRKAINDHCKWCIYDPKAGAGNWRQQVSACQITRCALWPVRPRSEGSVARSPESGPEHPDFGTPNWCAKCSPLGIGYCRCEIASNE